MDAYQRDPASGSPTLRRYRNEVDSPGRDEDLENVPTPSHSNSDRHRLGEDEAGTHSSDPSSKHGRKSSAQYEDLDESFHSLEIISDYDGEEYRPDENRNEDLHKLRRAFMNEIASPEILPFEEILIEDLTEQLENQQNNMDEADSQDKEEFFANSLKQLELERIKYMVTAYLRVRIQKIEEFAFHILMTQELLDRLSDKEKDHVEGYGNLLSGHFMTCLLRHLPENIRSLTESVDGMDMVERPSWDNFVFVRARVDLGDLQVDDRGIVLNRAKRGDLLIVRYRAVRALIIEGKVDLL